MTGNNPFGRSTHLRELAHQLDPTPEQKEFAKDCYEDLGQWLRMWVEQQSAYDVEIYPQGSRAHGTSNRHPETGEYDVDLVARVDVAKANITQTQLFEMLGKWLEAYVRDRQDQGHRCAPVRLKRGKRCWTLVYSETFHMDVLPVVPVHTGDVAPMGDPQWDASWLTDKALVRWQATNPRGLRAWFSELQLRERTELRELAKKVDVEPLPDDQPERIFEMTVLRMAVKILKRHRDHMFGADESKTAPPSVILTVLTGLAFERVWQPGMGLADFMQTALDEMPAFLNERDQDGNLVVRNPRCDDENHADRYAGRPRREAALHGWIDQAKLDIGDLATIHGADRISKRMTESFGADLGTRVTKRLATNISAVAAAGELTSHQGRLGESGTPHPSHTFYGDA